MKTKLRILRLHPRTDDAGRPTCFVSSQACDVCGVSDLGRRFSVEADLLSAYNPDQVVCDFSTWTVCHYCLTRYSTQ